MSRSFVLYTLGLSALLACAYWVRPSDSMLVQPSADPTPPSFELGGDASVDDDSQRAFGHPIAKMPFEKRIGFEVGDSLFNQNWVIAPASTTARDGLGPLFNARSCSACHGRDGRSQPWDGDKVSDGILFRLSTPGKDAHGGPVADPNYGGQFNHRAIPGATPEGQAIISYTEVPGTFADGTAYTLIKPTYTFKDLAYGPMHKDIMISPRVAPQMIGLGLLESIPEADILSHADPDDADGDGISGRPNRVWNVEKGQHELGRFGWKANQPSMRQQVAGAFLGDIGINSNMFPGHNHTKAQGVTGLDDHKIGGEPELTDRGVARVTFYSHHLAVPKQRNPDSPQVKKGWGLFVKAQCTACHVPTMKTGANAVSHELAHQTIHPFTDLLLHDMGEGLADNRPDFEATGQEWRTPPLWGIGLFQKVNGHTRYLHDGRARNLTEAILWHGGEAEASKEAFRGMVEEDRAALIAFLNSL